MKSGRSRGGKISRGRLQWIMAMVLFAAVFVVSAVKLAGILLNYHKANQVEKEFAVFKPTLDRTEDTGQQEGEGTGDTEEEEAVKGNPTLVEMVSLYPDVCGWVTIDGTNVDNVIAQGTDNAYYLEKALDGQETTYGTPFLDFRCKRDFSGVNNIVYGHNTKTKKMFAHVTKFKNKEYFESHNSAYLFLPEDTYPLQIVACLLIQSDDNVIYDPYVDYDTFVAYVKKNAVHYRETALSEGDCFLTLSTCSYEFQNARTVLVAKIQK